MIRSLQRSGALLFALMLTGCVIKQQTPAPVEPTQPTTPTQPVPPPTQPQQPPETVPQPPKLKTINWSASVQPLVANMVQSAGVNPGSVLMVDRIKNSTNGALQSDKATDAIQNALANNGKFTLVTPEQLAQAKQALGLSADDSLNSRSKAIGLARNVNAQYVLYSNAAGDVKSPTLQMQLMLVQTGEIIWSGNGVAQP
ncbi:MAG: penicillin-binding protein activator LpoB [Pantoea sp.]|uniref:Penicillin-binding protein activator LpoB n=1 Tax=Pantoea phytobeneficialis TaxID=2052056 RepID=A0AAP9H4C8_9GAMM|nr:MULTISPECIES: penicillin-binding protein activator LpoB [Pantoea]ERK08675.1 Lipoprotein YcfM [Pantoea sp. AS-PWVM4]MDO6407979.1 penicillin-binding protein activator LpoB [Pantoea phytobeneficialis]QGR06351.1 penicillin-binding protein activator LpoB [Pantoea phytobeneficialis]